MEWLAKNYPGEDIGFGRKYETMVFLAGKPCSAEGCNCGLPEIGGSEIECEGYNFAADANVGHAKLVEKYLKKQSRKK